MRVCRDAVPTRDRGLVRALDSKPFPLLLLPLRADIPNATSNCDALTSSNGIELLDSPAKSARSRSMSRLLLCFFSGTTNRRWSLTGGRSPDTIHPLSRCPALLFRWRRYTAAAERALLLLPLLLPLSAALYARPL